MAITDTPDLIEWRARLAHALHASLIAMDARFPAAEIARREGTIRALEQEGRACGFLWDGDAHGKVDRDQRHPTTAAH